MDSSLMDHELVERFLACLANEKRYSANTCQAYAGDIREFSASMADRQWESVQTQDVRGFVASLHRQGLNPRSIQRKLSSLRGFYRYLMREGILQYNPVEGVKPPKPGKKLPKVLDVDQVHRLLDIAPDDMVGIRDLAMLELFYGCGLRLSELSALKLSQLDLPDNSLRVVGKGNKMRQLPLGRHAKQALENWLRRRHQWADEGQDAVFLSTRGTPLANRSIQARLKHWGQKLGLGTGLHPHRLRHSFASHLLESSGDIRAVQELLGHENLSTTQVYTHLDFQHLAQVYDQAHPRAKK